MTTYGTTTPALETWLSAHSDPAYKVKKAVLPKPTKRRFSRNDIAFEAREFQYSFGFDYRTIREPVTLAEFIERKSDPKYKAWQLPKTRTSVPKLSAKARALESARIAHYVSSRSAG